MHHSHNSLKDTKLVHFYKSPLEKKLIEDDKQIEAMQKKVPHLNSGLPPRVPNSQGSFSINPMSPTNA